jgi:hypothetical protein
VKPPDDPSSSPATWVASREAGRAGHHARQGGQGGEDVGEDRGPGGHAGLEQQGKVPDLERGGAGGEGGTSCGSSWHSTAILVERPAGRLGRGGAHRAATSGRC